MSLAQNAVEHTREGDRIAIGSDGRAALRGALQHAVDRHPALRTTYEAHAGPPLQRIHDRVDIDFQVVGVRGLDDEALRRRASDEAAVPFDIARGPLLRARICDGGADRRLLLLAAHHLAVDFWSAEALLEELAASYAALRSGGGHAIEVAPGVERVVRREAAMLRSAAGERSRAYWSGQLCGELPVLDLPVNRSPPALRSSAGAAHRFHVPANLAGELADLARREGVTLYTVLLAGYAALLHRYSGQDDLIIGSPFAARSRELAAVVGCLIHTLPLRLRPRASLSFRELLAETRDALLGALAHQELPPRLIVEDKPGAYRSGLYRCTFVFDEARAAGRRGLGAFALGAGGIELRLGELALRSVALDESASAFDLTLMIADGGDGLAGTLRYRTDLFDASSIAALARHLVRLLTGAVRAVDTPLGQFALAGDAARTREPVERARAASTGSCVHARFESQAARTPAAIAVVGENDQLSYAELNRRANRLAWRLKAIGVGPDDRVGVCAGRSPDLIVGMLGALKAGAAYLPLDPDLPERRLALLVEEAGARAVVAAPHLAERIPAGPTLIVCDRVGGADADPPPAAGPMNLAYVMFTSGSTGRPRPVMVPHAALAAFAEVAVSGYSIRPGDRVLQFASPGWDTSIEEIVPTLLAGATLVLRTPAMTSSSAGFLDACRALGVSVANLPTAFWHELVRALTDERPSLPPSLRLVIVGGERALPERIGDWNACATGAIALVNTFGLTEVTAVATWGSPSTASGAHGAGSPGRISARSIGRPLPGVEVHILDDALAPVPAGVRGELYIGGSGLARGYLDRPGSTAERFVPDPFGAPGAQLYRTGDLARWQADGAIEFLGRADRQIKLRGHRIEPGEIEAALARQPGVSQAAVIVREDRPGDRRLIGYATPVRGAPPLDVQALRAALRAELPAYAVPSAVVAMPTLPSTASGKIDRAALPAPPLAAGAELRPPVTDLERTLAALWSDLLGAPRVGLDDNFFELGGDSIKAMQLVARAAAAGVAISAAQLFAHPTIAELAAHASAARVAPAAELAPAESDHELEGIHPLSPTQRGILFQALEDAGSGIYHQQLVYRLHGELDQPALRRAWGALFSRHAALRTSIDLSGPEPVQRVHRSADAPLGIMDWRDEPGDPGERLAAHLAADRARGFDLTTAPLMRASLVRLGDIDHELVVSNHHVVMDGWSAAVLLGELVGAYEAALLGKPVDSAPVRPYSDYLAWLSSQAAGDAEAFWRQLAGRREPRHRDRFGRPAGCRCGGATRRPDSHAAPIGDRRAGGVRRAYASDREHHRPGRVGAAPCPIHRRGGRRVRHHRCRPAALACRGGGHGRLLHQRPAPACRDRARREGGGLAARRPGAPGRGTATRAHAAG